MQSEPSCGSPNTSIIIHPMLWPLFTYLSPQVDGKPQKNRDCFCLFVFYILFIYFWLLWVFAAARGLSPVAASGVYSFAVVHGLLIAVASLVGEHRL